MAKEYAARLARGQGGPAMSEAAKPGPIACPFCDRGSPAGGKILLGSAGPKWRPAQPAIPARAGHAIVLAESGNRAAGSVTKSAKPAPFQFGVSTLLVIFTLAAVLFGIWKMRMRGLAPC